MSLTLFCYAYGEPNAQPFEVEIDQEHSCDALQLSIKTKRGPDFDHLSSDHLTLWKWNTAADITFNDLMHSMKLDPRMRIGDAFKDDPPRTRVIHVVVMLPSTRGRDLSDESNRTHPRPNKRVRLQESRTHEALPEINSSSPRLPRREFMAAMTAALRPFTQYMTDLANGQLDIYFNSIQPGKDTSLNVNLPTVPNLLLHSLGNDPDDARLEKLFKSDTVHLFSVSGSGKTRLSLEGLCHKWGIYITCKTSSLDQHAGSCDLVTATEIIESMKNTANPTCIVDVAPRVYAMLICARVFVLKWLLEQLPTGTDPETARRRWVLVQVMPPFNRTEDIFTAVLRSLRTANKFDMIEHVSSMLNDLTHRLGRYFFPPVRLFVVLDEVQVAAEYLNAGTEKRLVLHPFYTFLWGTLLFEGVILAGTGLSMKMVRNDEQCGAAEMSSYSQVPIVFVEVGRFTQSGADHKTYIEKYLALSTNVSDQRLMERMLYWFHGRYQFTASLIELLLSAQSGSPHRILTAFVHRLTGFTLTDAIDLEEREPPLTSITHDKLSFYGRVAESSFFEKGDDEVVKHIFRAVLRWRMASQTTPVHLNVDIHQTIRAGIGHLKKIRRNGTYDLTDKFDSYLCEPLVVLHLSSILGRLDRAWTTDAPKIVANKYAREFELEEVMLLVLLELFGGKASTLSTAFDTDQSWGSRKVTLVALKHRADGQMQSCPVSWTSGSSDRLCYKATSPDDVVEFLNNPDGMCFLFPDDHMGPDLLCFFQDVVTKELILLVLQCKLSKELKVNDCIDALKAFNPEIFYDVKRDGDEVKYVPSQYPDLLKDVVGTLDPNLGFTKYEHLVEGLRQKLCSSTKTNKEFESQPQRQTPRYIRILATRDSKQEEWFKAKSGGAVGVLRWDCVECVEELFGDVM